MEDEDAEPQPQPPQRRKKARRRAKPFIESEAGVDGDASEDESDGNDDFTDFIVPDDVEYKLLASFIFFYSLASFTLCI